MTYRAHLFRLRGFVTTPASAAAACRSTCTGPYVDAAAVNAHDGGGVAGGGGSTSPLGTLARALLSGASSRGDDGTFAVDGRALSAAAKYCSATVGGRTAEKLEMRKATGWCDTGAVAGGASSTQLDAGVGRPLITLGRRTMPVLPCTTLCDPASPAAPHHGLTGWRGWPWTHCLGERSRRKASSAACAAAGRADAAGVPCPEEATPAADDDAAEKMLLPQADGQRRRSV